MNDPQPHKKKPSLISTLGWWATLLMAVMAVPIIGTMIALSSTQSALGQMVVFVVACWISVWIGMWLMKKANAMHHHHPHHTHPPQPPTQP